MLLRHFLQEAAASLESLYPAAEARSIVLRLCEHELGVKSYTHIVEPEYSIEDSSMERLRRYLDPEEMKLAFVFLLTMPGAPFIYYGDEIGMRYVEGRRPKEGGYERTGSRTPMQWDDSPNAGFSEAEESELYLPLDPSADRPTAEGQLLSKNSLMREVKKLTTLRREHSALQSEGKIKFVSSGYPLVYFRSDEKEHLLVLINPSQRTYSLPFAKEHTIIYKVGKGVPERNGDKVIMPPETAAVLKLT